MQGRRRDLTEWSWAEGDEPQLWDYGKFPNGHWYGVTPAGMANLEKHEIVEHGDGTITVSPSILVGKNMVNKWHGFLERGIWREV